VILGFPEDQAFLRDIAERKRSILEEAVQEVLGRPAAVVCVATNLDAVPAATEPAAEIDLVEQARRIFGTEVPDVAEIR
jgi:hypothetical protein